MGAIAWAERAGGAARVAGRAPTGDGLTPTERAVAELVARGRTNRETAAALFLSINTVEAALTAVYGKLGIRSRTELARRIDDLARGHFLGLSGLRRVPAAPTIAGVATYLVESYLANRPRAVEHARTAARRAADVDPGIRYLRTTFLPSDETVFHLFEARSEAVIRAAASTASLPIDRITEAVELPSTFRRRSSEPS